MFFVILCGLQLRSGLHFFFTLSYFWMTLNFFLTTFCRPDFVLQSPQLSSPAPKDHEVTWSESRSSVTDSPAIAFDGPSRKQLDWVRDSADLLLTALEAKCKRIASVRTHDTRHAWLRRSPEMWRWSPRCPAALSLWTMLAQPLYFSELQERQHYYFVKARNHGDPCQFFASPGKMC